MELRDVETFLVLAEELHFRRAAARLHVSPGRVSQVVRVLERELGAPLFARNSRRVRLTPLGERFHVDARRGFDQLRQALADSQAAARGPGGRLRLGYVPCLAGNPVTTLIQEFEARYPDIQLWPIAMSPHTGFAELATGSIDALMIWSPGGGTHAVTGQGRTAGPILATSPRAVLTRADHPLAAYPALRVDQLADYLVLEPPTHQLPAAFAELWAPHYTPTGRTLQRAVRPDINPTGNPYADSLTLITIICQTQHISLTTRAFLNNLHFPEVTLTTITDLPPAALTIVHQTTHHSPTVQTLIATAQHVSEKLQQISHLQPIKDRPAAKEMSDLS